MKESRSRPDRDSSELSRSQPKVREGGNGFTRKASPTEQRSSWQEHREIVRIEPRKAQDSNSSNSVEQQPQLGKKAQESSIENFLKAQRSTPDSTMFARETQSYGTKPTTLPKTIVFRRKLCRGMAGRDVFMLQQLLQAQGYLTGEPDGEFGPLLEAAIARFQQDNNLAADGIWGTATCRAIASQTESISIECQY